MKFKVIFVINGLGTGGSERSLAEMLPYLVQANIQPIVICFYRRQEGVEQALKEQGFDMRFVEKDNLLSRVWALRRIIHSERPNLIHTTHFEADLVGRLAAMGYPVAVVNSLVNTPYEMVRYQDPNINTLKLRMVQVIDAWTAPLTTHFHAVSQAAKAAAIDSLRVRPEQITIIERGRNSDRLGCSSFERFRTARLKLGLNLDDEVIVNVGRHEYQKGQRYLLEAMAQLRSIRPKLILLIAGRSGTSSSELNHLRHQLSLNERVHFLGHREDVPEILAAADLFVFPSLYEGLPGAVIEAMALGLPIVASNIAPLREVVKENYNALLVEPASSTELVKAIETLLEDRDKANLFGQRSREIFENRFTLEKSISRMIELYNQITNVQR